MIALPAQSGGGPFRYFQMLLKKIAEYELIDVSFIIYKQKQISIEYLAVPSSADVFRSVEQPKTIRNIQT